MESSILSRPIHVKDMMGNSPLHRAVNNPNCTVDSIRKYLNLSCLDDRNFLWHTPLHCIIMNNCQNMDVIKLMIRKGANVNARDRNGSTPLHKAVQNHKCSTELIDLLIKNNAQLWSRQFGNETPLMVALQNYNPNLEIIEKLFYKACIDVCMMHSENNSTIRIICSDVVLIKAFLRFSTYVGPRGDSEYEYTEVEDVINFNCPKQICGFNSVRGRSFNNTDLATALLMFAVKYPCYNMDVIKLLLERGACIFVKNCQSYCVLEYALLNPSCSPQLIRELLEYGSFEMQGKIDASKMVSFLHVAAANRKIPVEVMKLLVKWNRGLHLNKGNAINVTPLDYAADFTQETFCNLEVVEYLLMKGGTACIKSSAYEDTSVLWKNVQMLGSPDANRDVLDCTKLLVKYSLVEKECCHPRSAYNSINVMCGRLYRRDQFGYLTELNFFLNQCFTEVMNMKRINFGPHNLYKSLTEVDSSPLFGDNYESTSKEVFKLLTSRQFPLYRRLIISVLSKQVFDDHACDVILYTANERGDTIRLNIYCMKNLAPYLENEDLFNLYVALVDPKKIEPPAPQQSSENSDTEISYESDFEEDVCPCLVPPKKHCCLFAKKNKSQIY